MKKLTYETVFKGACGMGRDAFARAFPKGAPNEDAILMKMATKPGLVEYFEYVRPYMTPMARKVWDHVLTSNTGSRHTDLQVVRPSIMRDTVRDFLYNMALGVFCDRKKGRYVGHDGIIFKGTRKVG